MKGITIKLPEQLRQQLATEARVTGRSIAAVVRDRLAAGSPAAGGTVHERAGDLAGVLAGARTAATNERRRFRRA